MVDMAPGVDTVFVLDHAMGESKLDKDNAMIQDLDMEAMIVQCWALTKKSSLAILSLAKVILLT